MKFKKLSLFLLGGLLLAGCSKASAIELSVVPNQSMVTGKAIVIDVKSEPVISINPNSIEISGGESWVENGVIKFKANEPGSYKMTVKQDNVTSNTITIDLGNTNTIAKNESQSTTSNKNSTTSKSSTNNQTTKPTTPITPSQGQSNGQQSTPSTPQYTPTPSEPTVNYPTEPTPAPTTPTITPDLEPTVPTTPSVDPSPVVTPEPDPAPSVPQETPTPEESTPVPEAPVTPTPDPEEDPASTVQETTMSVDQVYSDQNQLIANKTPITVDGQLPTTLVTDNSGKKVQVLWNDQTSEYIILEGFTIPFGGCTAQASGTLSRNSNGQLVLKMTYISTDDIPTVGDTGDQDPLPEDTTNQNTDSVVDRNNPTPHPEPGTNS